MNDKIFALDIGTRSITGIILTKKDDTYEVIDSYTKEHKERAMLDGQIHDIVAVADVIQEVKDTLEETSGPLTKVCVAAAGRALKTSQESATIPIQQQMISNEQMVKHLELSAVQNAQKQLITDDINNTYDSYHCVGYSVLHYELDGEKIRSLIDQKGENASVHVIATFLPKIIVESLLAVLDRVHLEMEALTLEPIAAIQILIPESMRRLNIALIDIGAGTSDIAITDNETIVGYGMVPSAGDEITEAISDYYLLDFKVAEQFKREAISEGEAMVQDILGMDMAVTKGELIEQVDETIDQLTTKVTTELLRLNNKPPRAVMLIGGGSLTPNICKRIAEKLQLPEDRVAVRRVDAIPQLTVPESFPSGPDFITPIGIAIAARQNPVYYIHLTINDQPYRLLHMNNLTVSDALIQSGIEIRKFYGSPGLASVITLNDQSITVPGKLGGLPYIYVNGHKVDSDALIQDGDTITINEGDKGTPASATIGDLLDDAQSMTVYWNKEQHTVPLQIFVNNKSESSNYIVQDKDNIIVNKEITIEQFLERQDVNQTAFEPFHVIVNEETTFLPNVRTTIYLNDKKADLTDVITNNSRLTLKHANKPTLQDLINTRDISLTKEITVHFNDEEVTLENASYKVMRNFEEITLDDELSIDDEITLTKTDEKPFIFQDIFRFVDLDLTTGKGSFTLYKNDQQATFFEPIEHGDYLYIKWDASDKKIANIPYSF
ncbi:MAG TPA: cell division FtsA domain-containing protein [Bacillota bacterium]|nr:cell division FtsA domain-containing protein [Bacillota bacterium]